MSAETLQELLNRYARGGGEELFAELVRRSGPLVWSVAMRRLQDAHLAEEAAQNVFIILARKARSLTAGPGLTAWLHRAATLEASNLARSRTRREQRLRRMANDPVASVFTASSIPAGPDGVATCQDYGPAGPWLDEALDCLPAADRTLLLGRFYEKRGFQDLAAELGKSEPALRKQAGRALEKLRVQLQRRAVSLSAAAVTGLLTSEFSATASAMPVVVAASITASAIGASSTLTTTVGTASSAWSSLLTLMSTPKATASAALLLLLLLVTSAWLELDNTARADGLEMAARRLEVTRNAVNRPRALPAADNLKFSARKPGFSDEVPPDPLTGMAVIKACWRSEANTLYEPGYDFWKIQDTLRTLSTEERIRILKEIDAAPVSAYARSQSILRMMIALAEQNPVWVADEMLKQNSTGVQSAVKEWAKRDPEAGWQWLLAKLKEGKLIRTGAKDSTNMAEYALQAFGAGLLEAGEARALEFVKKEGDPASRRMLVESVGAMLVAKGTYGKAVEFLAGAAPPETLRSVLAEHIGSSLRSSYPPEAVAGIVRIVNDPAFPQAERQNFLLESLSRFPPEAMDNAAAAMGAASAAEWRDSNLVWLAEEFARTRPPVDEVRKTAFEGAELQVADAALMATAQALTDHGNTELAQRYWARLGKNGPAAISGTSEKTTNSSVTK